MQFITSIYWTDIQTCAKLSVSDALELNSEPDNAIPKGGFYEPHCRPAQDFFTL